MIDDELEERIREEDNRLQITKLDNGIHVLTRLDTGSPKVSVACHVQAGAWDEVVGNFPRGTAHLLEHVLPRGPGKTLSEIFGGNRFNARTSRVETSFYGHFTKEQGLNPLERMLSYVSHPRFSKQDLKIELKRIREEWVELGDNKTVLDDLTDAYGGSPFALRPIGERPGQVDSIGVPELLAFHEENYRSDRVIVAVEGDVPHGDVVESVQRNVTLARGEPNSFSLPSYAGGDKRVSCKTFVKGAVSCAIFFPILSQAEKMPALFMALSDHENSGFPMREKAIGVSGCVYHYSMGFFAFDLHFQMTPSVRWMFNSVSKERGEQFIRELRSFFRYLARWTGAGHEGCIYGAKKREIESFRKQLGQPRLAEELCKQFALELFGKEQGALSCAYFLRKKMSLTPEDVNQFAENALKAPPTFRAVGAVRNAPSFKRIQQILSNG